MSSGNHKKTPKSGTSKPQTTKVVNPNLDSLNLMIATLSDDIANLESKNKDLEKKYKEASDSASLLTKDVEEKAIEITNLKKENNKLNQTIKELDNQLAQNKKEIEELTMIKKIHEQQNYDKMVELKVKYERERDDFEKKYLEMKNNYEEGVKNYDNLDKIFFEYKQEREKGRSTDVEKINQLEQEIKNITEELNNTKKNLEEKNSKLNESMNIVKNLQKENENLRTNMEEMKVETYKKLEDMKMEKEKASKNVFSNDKIFSIIADNVHNFFTREFSLSLNKIIEDIFQNFIFYTQCIFTSSESGDQYVHNDENLYIYNLKDIYFYIYFYVFNLKRSQTKQEEDVEISISNTDFTEEIVKTLAEEIYKNNLIHLTNDNSQKKINDYMNNLKKLGADDESLKQIEEYYNSKNEKFRIFLLNIIKSLVNKCADTIRNSTIEMNNKILYDFRNYTGDEFLYSENDLHIHCDKLTNEKIEILINILKYPAGKTNKIHFHNNFNNDLSEYNIQKILLNLMTYNTDVLSLRFNNVENINNNIMTNIIFAIQNLKNIKIISFESCKLNDKHIKIITEGLKESKSLTCLMVRKNNITSQGAFYLSEYLNTNKNIRQLFLGYNKINDKGLASLLNAMSTTNKNITHLDLSNNNFELKDFNALVEFLKTSPILNLLDISGNKLDLQSSVNLGSVLTQMKNIKSLNMSNMGINSDNTPILFKSFNADEIILDNNEIGEVGLIMLIKVFGGIKNLKKISLKNTQLSSIGLSSLLKMLEKTKDFKELHLENNPIDDMCINIMKTTLKSKQFKIFVSKDKVNQELFKDDALGKETNIIMV